MALRDSVVVDTDVVSAMHKRTLVGPFAACLVGKELIPTFVTIGELTRWVEGRRWGARRRAELFGLLKGSPELEYESEVARTWGRIMAAANRRGRTPQSNDAWIAACCLVSQLPLATLNTKDFVDFAEYHGLELVA